MTEREKMIKGELYNPADPELVNLRQKAHRLCLQFNRLFETDEAARCAVLKELLGSSSFDGDEHYFQGPVYFDYGFNISIGKNFYANFNTTMLDVCPVKIGDNVMLGTGVSLLTPVHPLKFRERNPRKNENGEAFVLEYARPIVIGDNCWLASNVTVIGGVTIGSGSVIGAGSVVTKDIPPDSFAAGNPCRVIKTIDNQA